MRRIKILLLTVFAMTVFLAAQAMAAPDSFVDVVKATRDGVVHVEVEGTKVQAANPFFNDEFFRRFFGAPGGSGDREYKFGGLGTGFIIDSAGFIITNKHVIEDASKITVKTSDGKEFTAELVGQDALTDLALLKITPGNARLKALKLGDSDALEIGEWAIAIGSPQGLDWTVTAGIISAKGRDLGAGPYDSFIQTDASINQGNSGGPLINMKGEVVGVNSMIFANSQGLGFAVPINTVKDLLPQLKAGAVRRGWMGVTLQDMDNRLAESFGIKDGQGALVADVIKGEPADRAGVKSGDVIIAADGKSMQNTKDIVQYVGSKQPNETVRLTVVRDGKPITIGVKLAEREGSSPAVTSPTAPSSTSPIRIRELNASEKAQYEVSGGIMVTNVLEDSAPARAGLRPGDVIVWMNRKDINSVSQFTSEYATVAKSGSISLKIVNSGGARFIAFAKD